LAIVDRLRPEWVIFENVPGLLSANGGRDFGSFLGALAELRYGFAYRILDARHFGVAQRRRRVFVVANATDWRRAAAVLFEPESLRRSPPKGRSEGGSDRSGGLADAPVPTGGDGLWWDGGRLAQTLDAVLYKKQAMPEKNRFPVVRVAPWVECPEDCDEFLCELHGEHVQDCPCPPLEAWTEFDLWPYEPSVLRYLTPVECERLQGFPDDWTSVPFRGKPAADAPRYKAIGNSMAVPVVRWIGERIAAIDKVTK
jgi:DNA (cytosine-5)-methyltransferase 1